MWHLHKLLANKTKHTIVHEGEWDDAINTVFLLNLQHSTEKRFSLSQPIGGHQFVAQESKPNTEEGQCLQKMSLVAEQHAEIYDMLKVKHFIASSPVRQRN